MTKMRVAFATALSQLVGIGIAAAQPTPPPPDDGQAKPADTTTAEPPVEGTPPVEPPEVPAEEVAPPIIEHAPTGSIGYDKGFFLKSTDEKYELKINARIQPFYTGTFAKGAGNPDKHDFEIRRMRLTLEGKIHNGAVGWKMQTDYGKGFLTLKDAHFDWKVADDMWLRVGQWKRPFSRQQINSSGKLELTTRAITDEAFGAERDIGIAIRNDYEKSPELEWTFGVFNGQGVKPVFSGTVVTDPATGNDVVSGGAFTTVPKRFKPAFIGRIGFNQGGIKGYSEADLEGGPLRWGAAASVWVEADRDKDDKSNDKVELDFIVKNNGLSASGGFYGMSSQQGIKTFSDQALSHVGFHLQAGYMATKNWQPVVRYALVDVRPDFESATAKDAQELGLGANYFAFGHDAKFQGALRLVKEEGAELRDIVVFELGANVGF